MSLPKSISIRGYTPRSRVRMNPQELKSTHRAQSDTDNLVPNGQWRHCPITRQSQPSKEEHHSYGAYSKWVEDGCCLEEVLDLEQVETKVRRGRGCRAFSRRHGDGRYGGLKRGYIQSSSVVVSIKCFCEMSMRGCRDSSRKRELLLGRHSDETSQSR